MDAYAWCLIVWLGACATRAEREIIVIGAGASGLAAARALTNEGNNKVTVLEARPNRYGGRIWTNVEGFRNVTGPEVDMGASFIHDVSDNNSVVQLHREFNLPMLDVNHGALTVVREKDSMAYTQTRVVAASERVEKAFDAVRNFSVTQKADLTVYEAFRQANQSQFINNPLSQLFVALKEFDFGSPVNKLSAKLLDVGYMEESGIDKIPALGYSQMLDRIVQNSSSDSPLNIILGQEVAEVTVLDNRRVQVKCKNNEKYEADAVIVTLPLGVLKADDVKFTPDLSKRKRRAIKRIGFGVVNKLVLEFDKRFWPEEKNHLTIAVRNMADRGKFSLLTTFHAIAGKPVIVAYAISHFGKQSEKLTDDEMKLLALNRLRTVFGSIMDPVSVVAMARSRWYNDPYSKGSYSFPAVGTRPTDWDIVGEAQPPLFFAGEHTRTKHYGTVHTAIDTGRRAAMEAKEYLNNNAKMSGAAVTRSSWCYTIFFISFLLGFSLKTQL